MDDRNGMARLPVGRRLPIEPPMFAEWDEVLTKGTRQEGVVKSRRFKDGRWAYEVRVDGRWQTFTQESLEFKPMLDNPVAWLASSRPTSTDSPRR